MTHRVRVAACISAGRGAIRSNSDANHDEQRDESGSRTRKHAKTTVSGEVGNVSARS